MLNGTPSFCLLSPDNLFLDYRDPDTFASVASRFHDVDELMQSDAGVHHHALEILHAQQIESAYV